MTACSGGKTLPDRIGSWAHRAGTRSHLIESVIGDRYVTRCGKQLRAVLNDWEDTKLVFDSPNWSFPACLQCAGGRRNSLLLNEEPTLSTRGDAP